MKVDSMTDSGINKFKSSLFNQDDNTTKTAKAIRNKIDVAVRGGNYSKTGHQKNPLSMISENVGRRSKSSKYRNKKYNAYTSNEKSGSPLLPSIGKGHQKEKVENNYLNNSYKDFSPVKKRSYSITNFKDSDESMPETFSPANVPTRYFKDISKIKLMNKIRIPKTSNGNKNVLNKNATSVRNTTFNKDNQSNRTDDFMRKLNYSFDNQKMSKNKVQLKALDEKSLPDKTAVRAPVFERLTQGLLKNTKLKRKKIEEIKVDKENNISINKIRKVHPFSGIQDELEKPPSQKGQKMQQQANPYSSDYLNTPFRPRMKKQSVQNRSLVLEKHQVQLSTSSVKKFTGMHDIVSRYDFKTQVGKNNGKDK